MALSLERIKELVAAHTPVLCMHPADRFMPCSVEWFMQRSELWLDHPVASGEPPKAEQLLSLGEVSGPLLAAIQKQYPPERLHLRLDPAAQTGPPLEQLDDVPLYANVKWVVLPNGNPEALEINYLTFYSHNGSYDLGGLGLMRVGAHDGDWEHFTVRLHASTGLLQGAWYNAHRSRDGRWVPAASVERTPEGRLKAYVALHGHGTYPSAGTWFRAAFLANDRCSGKGPVWRPRTCYILRHPHLDSRSHHLIPPSADEAPATAAIEPRVPSTAGRPSIELTSRELSAAVMEGTVAESDGVVIRVPVGIASDCDAEVSASADQRMSLANGQPGALPTKGVSQETAAGGLSALANKPGESRGNHQVEGDSLQQQTAPRGTAAGSEDDGDVQGRSQLESAGFLDDEKFQGGTQSKSAGFQDDREIQGGAQFDSASEQPVLYTDTSAARRDAAHLVAGSGNSAAALIPESPASVSELSARFKDSMHVKPERPFVSSAASGADLMCVPSRGSSLPASGRELLQSSTQEAVDAEVLVDSSEWLQYLGEWGQTPSPAAQDWFWTAEPPVSRNCLLRVIGHLWPETLALE